MVLTVTGSKMPQTVDIKGVGKVHFPDGYTPEQIQQAIERDILPKAQTETAINNTEQQPEASLGGRVANSLLKGAAGFGTLPDTVQNIAGGAGSYVGRQIRGAFTGDYSPNPTPAPNIKIPFPSYQQAIDAGRNILGVPDAKASSIGGKIFDGAVENLNVGSKAKALASALIGAGAETAGQAGDVISPEAGLAARFAGGAVTGAGIGVARALQNNAGNIIADTFPQKPTQTDVQQAIAAQLQGKEIGVPLTAGEAYNSAPLNRLLANASSTPQGAAIAEQFFKQRPNQVKGVINNEILPKLGADIPASQAAELSQKAASNTLNATDRAITDATKDFYGNLNQTTVPPSKVEQLVRYLDSEIAKYPQGTDPTKTLLIQTRENLLNGAPPAPPANYNPVAGDVPNQSPPPVPTQQNYQTNGQVLNNVRQELYRKTELPSVNPESIDKKQFEAIAPVYGGIDAALREADPLGYAQGQERYAKMRTEIANPEKRGIVGKLAGTGYDPANPALPIETARGILFDTANSADEIRKVYKSYNNQDAAAYPALVRAEVTAQLDKATKDLLQTGDSPASLGAKFTQALTGTDKQKQNFKTILEGIDEAHSLPTGATYNAFDKVFKVLRRTAQTPSVGSPTGEKTQFFNAASSSKLAGASKVASLNPLQSAANALEARALRKNSAEIVKILTSPESAELVARLAKAKPNSAGERLIINQIIQNARETAQYQQGEQ